jgi:spore maturation protein B
LTEFLNTVSRFAVPFIIILIILCGIYKKVNVYTCFLEGAKEGLSISLGILPSIIGLLFAIGMFRASGALGIIINLIEPLTSFFKIPPEILPFALMRPVSGSGSLAMATDIFKTYGPDSFVGRVASVMMGSTETTFYTLAVYFGATKATNTRYTLKCSLLGDMVCLLLSVLVCKAFF